jgi:membrane protease subunit (stomatin/prohibitin family)
MDEIEFVSNYVDKSTDNGFQYEFHCNRCNNGYRTSFQPWAAGAVSNALDAANSLFGGVFNQASNAASRVRSATWQQAHDNAFKKAVEEIRPQFAQCPRCSGWVCRKRCWNEQRGLCKNCAPDLATEISAQQSAKAIEKIMTDVGADAEDSKVIGGVGTAKVKAACPKCGTPLLPNAKFCPECGEKLNLKKHCTECGAELPPNAKFCGECGAKTQ